MRVRGEGEDHVKVGTSWKNGTKLPASIPVGNISAAQPTRDGVFFCALSCLTLPTFLGV